MADRLNLVICGQSGQGIIMISKILLTAFLEEGFTTLCTEYPADTHRFATTFSHIRIGDDLFSTRIRPCEADVIIGLEPFECMKVSLIYGNPSTLILTDDQFVRIDGVLNPLLTEPVRTESVEDIVDVLRGRGLRQVIVIKATDIALQTLRHRTGANMAMLGAAHASGRIPLTQERLEQSLASVVPKGTVDRNLAAFRTGRAAFETADRRAAVTRP